MHSFPICKFYPKWEKKTPKVWILFNNKQADIFWGRSVPMFSIEYELH